MFGAACLSELSDAASSLLDIDFNQDQIGGRNSGFAKQQVDRDLRCPMLWTVLDIWAARPSGIQGASKEFNIPRVSLLRYYNNCNAKLATLEAVAVANVEKKILHHLGTILSAAKPADVKSNKATAEERITPLHFTSESGGGAISVYALGERVRTEGWVFKSQRDQVEVVHVLRRGFRLRKLFKKKGNSRLSGRCFEWYIVADASPASFRPGLPKFILHELVPDAITQILCRTHKWIGDSPQQMWDAMYKDKLGADHAQGTNNGVRLCGLDDPGVLQLLDSANACDDELAYRHADDSKRSFGHNKPVCQLQARSMAALVHNAGEAFCAAMTAICPKDPQAAFHALRRSSIFMEWSPDVVDTPFFRGMAEAYRTSETRETKAAILSLFAPYFPVKVTEALFGVDHNEVHKAKLHSAMGNAGVQLERLKHEKFRMDPQKFAFLHQWARSDYASKDGDPGNDLKIRVDIRIRLYEQYKIHARIQFPDKDPVSMGHFYEEMGAGFMDQDSESYCCCQCVEGWNHLNMIKDFIADPSNHLLDVKGKTKRADEIRHFLDYDYRWNHLKDSSEIATHCCNHALGSPQECFTNSCDHQHTNTCVECNMWPVLRDQLVSKLRCELDRKLLEIGSCHPPMVYDPTVAARRQLATEETECREVQLQFLDDEYHRFVAHIVRKHISSRAQLLLVSEQAEGEGFLWIDYKAKPLEGSNREPQADSFGKKGKSLFGLSCMFKIPAHWSGPLPKDTEREGDVMVVHVRVACDDSEQSAWHSAQVLITALQQKERRSVFHSNCVGGDGRRLDIH